MTNTLTSETAPAAARAQAGKHLTFMLGQEYYGIPVLTVREIIRMVGITTVPRMPEFIRGVINLRGKIIPVLDLRLRFDLPVSDATERTCIIVVQITQPSGAKAQLGLIVDAVEEVVNIAASDIEETPDFGPAVDTKYIVGMAKIKGQVKALLDIDKVINGESIQELTT
jgi:purine-binding chemotaxis protein CheW